MSDEIENEDANQLLITAIKYNQVVHELKQLRRDKKELEEQLKETISEFKNCYKALEFFEKYADCRTNNVYHCNCNFCKDREHSVLKINARAYLEKWKEWQR